MHGYAYLLLIYEWINEFARWWVKNVHIIEIRVDAGMDTANEWTQLNLSF